jgi:hypothetical protein
MRGDEIFELIAQVKAGALSRRAFIGKMVLLGITGTAGRPDVERQWRPL